MDNQMDVALLKLERAGIKLNRNHRRDLIELISDIAGRDGVGASEILEDDEIKDALDSKKLNGPQKLTAIKEALVARRYPTHARARAAFFAELKQLGLSQKIKIQPSPFFEDNKLTVEFSFSDPDELREILKSLESLGKTNVIENALAAVEDFC